jgi:hypothetical protein
MSALSSAIKMAFAICQTPYGQYSSSRHDFLDAVIPFPLCVQLTFYFGAILDRLRGLQALGDARNL